MNLVILANHDLAANFALNLLAPMLQQHQVSLMLSRGIGSSGNAPELTQLASYEHKLYQSLCHNKEEEGFLGFEALAKKESWPIAPCSNANTDAGLAWLKLTQPDLIVSIRYGHILKQPAIDTVKQVVINLHSGLLPDYRGVMASFWALLAKEPQLATTLHTITDKQIDQGSNICCDYLIVDPTKSYLWHVLSLYPAGCRSIIDTINTIDQGQELKFELPTGSGEYFSFPTAADLAGFKSQGWQLYREGEAEELLKPYYCKASD